MFLRLPNPAALVLLLAAAVPVAAHDADFTVASFFEQPELFQIATLAGGLAVLRQIPEAAARPGDAECFEGWTAHDDVLAILAWHIEHNPLARHDPFGATLAAALRERCRSSP